MGRRTRGLQFFATPHEVQAVLAELAGSGLHLFATDLRTTVPWSPGVDARRVLVGPREDLPGDAHREPARWGAVYLDPPTVEDGRLVMAELSAVNAWVEDGEGLVDDSVLDVFARVARVIRGMLVGTVDGVMRTGEERVHYPSLRLTEGALLLVANGTQLVQRGSVTVVYLPHDPS